MKSTIYTISPASDAECYSLSATTLKGVKAKLIAYLDSEHNCGLSYYADDWDKGGITITKTVREFSSLNEAVMLLSYTEDRTSYNVIEQRDYTYTNKQVDGWRK